MAKIKMKRVSLTLPSNYKRLLKVISEQEDKAEAEVSRDIHIQYIDWWVSNNGTYGEVL
jgi:hypothetical protein